MTLEDLIGYQSQNRSLIEIWESEIEGSGDKPGCEPPTKVRYFDRKLTGSDIRKFLVSSMGSGFPWSYLDNLDSIG